MLKESGHRRWKGKYISFEPDIRLDEWEIWSDSQNVIIGQVRWYSHWRKYCFFPSQDTVWEEICLGEISDFIKRRTTERRQGKVNAPA